MMSLSCTAYGACSYRKTGEQLGLCPPLQLLVVVIRNKLTPRDHGLNKHRHRYHHHQQQQQQQ